MASASEDLSWKTTLSKVEERIRERRLQEERALRENLESSLQVTHHKIQSIVNVIKSLEVEVGMHENKFKKLLQDRSKLGDESIHNLIRESGSTSTYFTNNWEIKCTLPDERHDQLSDGTMTKKNIDDIINGDCTFELSNHEKEAAKDRKSNDLESLNLNRASGCKSAGTSSTNEREAMKGRKSCNHSEGLKIECKFTADDDKPVRARMCNVLKDVNNNPGSVEGISKASYEDFKRDLLTNDSGFTESTPDKTHDRLKMSKKNDEDLKRDHDANSLENEPPLKKRLIESNIQQPQVEPKRKFERIVF